MAKIILYIAKRVKPEFLSAVSFLTSTAGAYDTDDLGKGRRLLGYIRKTTHTAGVCFRIGSDLIIRVFDDAAYGEHIYDGKSHSGVYTVLGLGGLLHRDQSAKLLGRSRIWSGAGDHLPGQLELHGHNGTRKPDIGEVEAHHQHPVLLALRENKTRRGDIGSH